MLWSVVFCSVVALTVVSGETPSLEILPNMGVVSKQLDNPFALTCKPKVDNPSQISELEWRDSKNVKIESNRKSLRYVNSNPSEDKGLVLIFEKLRESDAGNYTCRANYASEELKASVTVTTFRDITFVDAPESQYPRLGEDFLVKCKVEGNPTPQIDWYKDDLITTSKKYILSNEGLTIKNVQESDDGTYRCSAYVMSTGQIKAKNIKVEVIIPPVIEEIKPITVIEGKTASVKCEAKGKPAPSYTWIKESNSQDLSKTDRFDVKKNTGFLMLNRVEAIDDGVYICVAENQAGRAERKVKIDVLSQPNIYELTNVTAPITLETKIICKTKGKPVPNVTFRKLSNQKPFVVGQQPNDPRIILEQRFFEDKRETFGTLIISNLNRSDDGLYQCIAENDAGTAYKNGHITVQFPPTFERTKDLPPAWAWVDHPGNLSCIPEAIPNATIVWKYGNTEIRDNMPPFTIQGHGPVSNLIVNVSPSDHRYFGTYECIARNTLGRNSIKLQLREATVPGLIKQVKSETITATTVKFNIVPPNYFDGLPIRSFTVQYKLQNDLSWDLARNHTWSFRAPYILENLTPERTYDFRFAARNDVGLSGWTNIPSLTMPRRSEPAEPKILHSQRSQEDNNSNREEQIFTSPYADHYDLRWGVPNDNGDPIDYYLIRYCVTQKINGGWQDSDCSEEIKQSVQYTNYELNGLKPDTVYKIELRAHNSIGSSSPAQIKVKTARGFDPTGEYHEPPVTNLAIIGIVVGAVVLVLILVDLICFCVNRAGILAFFCYRNKAKHSEEDPKLGSYKAAPAHPNSLNLPLPVKLASSPTEEREPLKSDGQMNGERNMSVEFDGKHVYSKSGEIIGKHSAV